MNPQEDNHQRSGERGDFCVSVDGHQVRGRAARMIDWLARRQAEVNRPKKGRLEFYFAGHQISGELAEKHERIG